MSETAEIASWLRAQAEAKLEAARGGEPYLCESCQVLHEPSGKARDDAAQAESVLAVLDLYEQTAALVREPPTVTAPRWPGAEPQPGMISARDYMDARRELAVLEPVVRLLARGYRHREGYEAAWKP